MLPTQFGITAGCVLYIVTQANGQFPATISPPVALNTNAGNDLGGDERPRIATDGQGHWVAVWQSEDTLGGTIQSDLDILVSRSINNGVTWTAPAPLNGNAASDTGMDELPQVVTDGKGTWLAVWDSNENLGGATGTDGDILFARSTNDGATWSPPTVLNMDAVGDVRADHSPEIATDGQGHWVAVWESDKQVGLGAALDIHMSRSADNGITWTSPVPLNSKAGLDTGANFKPQIATDKQGHWVVVWQSYNSIDGSGTDGDILVTRSADDGETWTRPVPLNSNAFSDAGFDEFPNIATDEHGHWVAVWDSNNTASGAMGTDVDVFMARSEDNGATWTDPVQLNNNAGNDSGYDEAPYVTTDGRGNWVATWDSNGISGGTDFDVFVAYSSDNGTTWTDPVPLNTNAGVDGGDDYGASLASDGRGNWVAVWYSNDSLGATIGIDNDILTTHFAFPDCNGNGIGDSQDIADGTSKDCNHNGVPDDCEADSDGDGVIDPCDNCPNIANPDQADANGNGIGDACESTTPLGNAACGTCGNGAPSMFAVAGAFLMALKAAGIKRPFKQRRN